LLLAAAGLAGCSSDPTSKGWALAREGKIEQARAQFTALSRTSRHRTAACLALAELEMSHMRPAEAERALSAALATEPSSPALLAARGEAVLGMGRQAEAYRDFLTALQAAAEGPHVPYIAGLLGDAYETERLTHSHTDNYAPTFAPDGASIVFTRHEDGSGELIRMDLSTFRTGRLAPMPTTNEYGANWSRDGRRLLFASVQQRSEAAIITLQASGSGARSEMFYILDGGVKDPRPLTTSPIPAANPVFSPDARAIAFEAAVEGNLDIWTMSPQGGDRKRLTTGEEEDGHPVYRPDGKTIAFVQSHATNYDLMEMNVDGSNVRQRTFTPMDEYGGVFSPDGRHFAHIRARGGEKELVLLDWRTGRSRVLSSRLGNCVHPAFSPDGKRMLFASDRSDYLELYVMDLTRPVPADRLQRQLRSALALMEVE
jgi:Tol biopolymer transport system component